MREERNVRVADLSRFAAGRAAISVLLVLIFALGCTRGTTSQPPSGEASPPQSDAATDEASQPQGDVILELEGDGEAISDHFSVKGNWELRWESRGSGPFTVELFTDDGTSRGIIVQGEGGKDGSAFASEEGSFSLLITAEGPWSIRVLGKSS